MRRTPERDAIAMCWPSTHPRARRSDQYASRRDRFLEEAPRLRNPLRGICAGSCASGGSGTVRRVRVTRYPRSWRDMVQSSRMRGTLTSQSAVEPQERAISGTEQLRRAHRPYACGIVLLDQGETTAKRNARSSATPIRRERVIHREADDVGAATQRCCPRVRSHPLSVTSIAKA